MTDTNGSGGSNPALETTHVPANARRAGLDRTYVRAGHAGRCPGFVHEDRALGIEVRLVLEPLPVPLQDVRALLFRSVTGPFLRVMRWRWKKRCSVV